MTIKELFRMIETANFVAGQSNSFWGYRIKITICDEVYNNEFNAEFIKYNDFIKWVKNETNYDIMNWLKDTTFDFNERIKIVNLTNNFNTALGTTKTNFKLEMVYCLW